MRAIMKRTAVASAVVLATGLAGCAAGENTSEEAASGTIKMVLWPGPEGDAMKTVVKKYNESQGKKDGVTVELVLLSRSDTFTKEATEMASKSPRFDAYFTASYQLEQHAAALEPLSDVDTSGFFPQAVDGMKLDGKQMALPLDVSLHFLFYRKDLIEAMLQDPGAKETFARLSEKVVGKRLEPKDPAQWTWDDYLATAAYFTKSLNPESPTPYGTEVAAKNTPFNVMYWNDVLWGSGGNWLKDGKADLTSPAAKKAMNVYQTAFKNKLVPPNSVQGDFPELQASMQAGSVAFIHQWAAGYTTLNDSTASPKTAGKIGIAPPPGQKAHVHFLGVGINKYSKKKPATVKWFKYLASNQAQQQYARGGGVPSSPSVLGEMASSNEVLGLIADSVEKYGYVEPRVKGSTQFQIFVGLGDALSGGWVNNESPETSLGKAQEVVAKLNGQ